MTKQSTRFTKRPTRRRFIKDVGTGMGLLWLSPAISPAAGCGGASAAQLSNIGNLGPLGDPDENGVQVPEGFTVRIVGRSGVAPIAGAAFVWHNAPDGGATYATDDGGWIYVSNSEAIPGGASALRFDSDGTLVDAYSILADTVVNCAGGATPWGTWLSCEEVPTGRVWECDPTGAESSVVHPSLGVFSHEAVAVDFARGQLYLTEDEGDGLLYRFTSSGTTGSRLNLDSGLLEAAAYDETSGAVTWLEVPNPTDASGSGTRGRVPGATPFDGGEGIWLHGDALFFSTKGDNRIWEYDVANESLSVLYDMATSDTPILSGVDNIVVSSGGDVIVAEDGGNMELVALPPGEQPVAIARVVGQDQSEITGPAFNPAGDRLYFSSQRGPDGGPIGQDGITYEMSGPFFELA